MLRFTEQNDLAVIQNFDRQIVSLITESNKAANSGFEKLS